MRLAEAKAEQGKQEKRNLKGAGSLPLLQHRLALNSYLCQQLGERDFKTLREKLHNTQEGWTEEGHSYFFYALRGIQGVQISEEKLAGYDLNIKAHLERMNRTREPRVQLKYFQYLAALFTEIYLDKFFNARDDLLKALNGFLDSNGWREIDPFTENDLTKLAFWMATGSGKTLVMHLNLWQYLHYSADKVAHDNILLITPNEGLSRQHLEEFRKSGIRACRYDEAEGGLFGMANGAPIVRVIEITKLTESKRGGGLSVAVESFGTNNLLLVDEGHRGASGEVWRSLREKLARDGFTFEYSATFGQIVNGASQNKRRDLLNEYAKAILFDYSYPHFYHDGYGKDYFILNLSDTTNNTFSDWMLLGNLLSFYEQLMVYSENHEALRPFNVEKPLWVFVGHSVTGGSSDDEQSLTDVQEIVGFLHRFLSDRNTWSQQIVKLLSGQSGLKDGDDNHLFHSRFPALRRKYRADDQAIYDAILQSVFHAKAGNTLQAVALKNAPGEIGLRAGETYFGVINIGDVAGLMKRISGQGVACTEDNINRSLFERINAPDSPVNILIGSRKFMEGWDSFRVSSMGLMNIGKGEGSQIIQLFGRGVRLWGKDRSLKRSQAIHASDAPPDIRLLETLNVFGVRANYMAQFREYLKQEGIETDFEEVRVPVQVKKEFLEHELQVLRLPDGKRFEDDCVVALACDQSLKVSLDLRPRIESMQSGQEGERIERAGGENQATALKGWVPLLNWERLYLEMLEFRRLKGMHNLSFTRETLRKILEEGNYTLLCSDAILDPKQFNDLRRVEEIALSVLKKYLAAFYDRKRREWERQNLQLAPLTEEDPNLKWSEPPEYTLRIAKTNQQFLEQVKELLSQADRLYKQDVQDFPHIHFDRHLYLPLLLAHEQIESMTPPGLDENEAKFVRDLREYLQQNSRCLNGKQIFLLRNQTRGAGIGFFDSRHVEAFYPDFILWVVDRHAQRIAFIDPHGLRMARGGFNDPKICLHKELEAMSRQIRSRGGRRVRLTSFILSTSPYAEIEKAFGQGNHTQEEFEQNHVLFMEDTDYLSKLIDRVLQLEPASNAQRDGFG